MKMIRALLGTLLMLANTPAYAQLTATYRSPNHDLEMRIEISPQGDVHMTMPGASVRLITIRGESYMIESGDRAPSIYRASDIGVVMAETMPDLAPGLSEVVKEFPPLTFEQRGTVTINGRTGKAYYPASGAGEQRETPVVVISEDPALHLLGTVMAGQFRISMRMMPPQLAGASDGMKPMLDILESGAPLSFAGMELVEVSTAPIPAEHFVLPAEPRTLDQVRARMAESGGRIP